MNTQARVSLLQLNQQETEPERWTTDHGVMVERRESRLVLSFPQRRSRATLALPGSFREGLTRVGVSLLSLGATSAQFLLCLSNEHGERVSAELRALSFFQLCGGRVPVTRLELERATLLTLEALSADVNVVVSSLTAENVL
jgi:hypothetical protein